MVPIHKSETEGDAGIPVAKVIPGASGREKTCLCIPRVSSSDRLLSTSPESAERT